VSGTDEAMVTVRLIGLRPDFYRSTGEHYEAARREMSLIAADEAERRGVPARFGTMFDELNDRWGSFTMAPGEELAAAARAGAATVDINYEVPESMLADCRRFYAVLDEVDAFCRAGRHLLTVPNSNGEIFRRWFLGEFIRQLEGGEPLPWDESPEAELLARQGAVESVGDSAGLAIPVDGALSVARRSATAVTLRLSGEVDLDQAPSLRRLFADLLADGVVEITVDGSDVDFIDSVGVSVLMAMFSRCAEAGGSMAVSAPSTSLLATLELAGVADVLIRD
jgi:anti-anti-sigma factor